MLRSLLEVALMQARDHDHELASLCRAAGHAQDQQFLIRKFWNVNADDPACEQST